MKCGLWQFGLVVNRNAYTHTRSMHIHIKSFRTFVCTHRRKMKKKTNISQTRIEREHQRIRLRIHLNDIHLFDVKNHFVYKWWQWASIRFNILVFTQMCRSLDTPARIIVKLTTCKNVIVHSFVKQTKQERIKKKLHTTK